MRKIEVFGVSAGENIPDLHSGNIVFAGKRLLKDVPGYCRKVELKGDWKNVMRELLETTGANDRIVVLGSGDPLFHGIGGALLREFTECEFSFTPQPAAFQLLAAKSGIDWSEAELFSLHAVSGNIPFKRILRAKTAIIYTDPERDAAEVARRLVELYPLCAEWQAVIGVNLGLTDEMVFKGKLSERSEVVLPERSLNILAVQRGVQPPVLPLGLPDENYRRHKDMITHPEVRAVVLAKLRIAPGVMWDLGAGSGSVGIEAAGLCRELRVYAVEKDYGRIGDIEFNMKHSGVDNVIPVCGDIMEKMVELPDPDRIFVGGGGAQCGEIMSAAFERLKPGGIMVVVAVRVESAAVVATHLREFRRELFTLSVYHASELAGNEFWRGANPITIAVFSKGNCGI